MLYKKRCHTRVLQSGVSYFNFQLFFKPPTKAFGDERVLFVLPHSAAPEAILESFFTSCERNHERTNNRRLLCFAGCL